MLPRPIAYPSDAAMARNLRILPWWWVVRWFWLGEGIWVVYLMRERGLTLGEVLLFQGAYNLVMVLTEVPTGMVADHFGRRVSLIVGSVIAVLAFLLFGAGPTVALLLGAYALFALSDTLFSGADSAMLFDSLKALRRDGEFTRATGRLNALVTGAIALFTVAGALMTLRLPLSVPLILSGVLTLPSVFLAWRLVEPPRDDRRHDFLATGRLAARRVAGTPALWSATLLMAATTSAIFIMSQVIQPIVLDYGVPVWALGFFVGVQMALAAASSWLAHAAGRVVPLRHLFWAMPAVSALSLIAGASGSPWLFPLFILPSIGWNVLWPHFADYVSRRAPDSQRATTISITSLAANAATILVSPVTGLAVDGAGLGHALTGVALVLLACIGFAYLVWWRAGDHDAEALEVRPSLASE